jgi:hypothetical protein
LVTPASKVNDCSELAVGSVPLINPDEDRVRPDGKEPLCSVQTKPLPPLACSWKLYGWPHVATGREVVVTCSGVRIVIVTEIVIGELVAFGDVTVNVPV